MRDGASLIGTIQGDADPDQSIPMLIDWYRTGRLPLEKIEQTFPVDSWKEAVAALHTGATVKAVLVW